MVGRENEIHGDSPARAGEADVRKVLMCYAEGRDGDWEAFCLDLDIAVQGETFEEVFHALNDAIALYLETVMELPEEERGHLLNSPAPLSLRVKFLARAARALFGRHSGDGYHHQFTLPCAA